MNNVLEFYPARCSVTAKRLLNGPAHLILGITDANGISFLREPLIYRFSWPCCFLFSSL